MKPFKPRPIQLPMIDFMRNNKRCAVWMGMGGGKSSAALFTIDLLRLLGEVGDEPWLVLGPVRVARDVWPEEVTKWDQFQHLRIMPLIGTPKERIAKLHTKADIFTCSYELARWGPAPRSSAYHPASG